MKKLKLGSSFIIICLTLVLAVSPSQSAKAMSWSCTEYTTKVSVALGKGDVGGAASAQNALTACRNSGAGAAVATSISGCSPYQDAYLNSISRGDIDSGAIYKSAYNDCVANTSTLLGNNNSGGGSGGGSSEKSCDSPPNSPTLSVAWGKTGIRVAFKRDLTGQKTEEILYSYTFYDSNSRQWGDWRHGRESFWGKADSSFSELFSIPSQQHTQFELVATSSNRCGDSLPVNLGNGYGIPGAGPLEKDLFIQTKFTISSDYYKGKELGWGTDVDSIGESDAQIVAPWEETKTAPLFSSLTPSICKVVEKTSVKTFKTSGICKLRVRTTGDEFFTASSTVINLKVLPFKTVTVLCTRVGGKPSDYKFYRGISATKLQTFKCPTPGYYKLDVVHD